MWPMMAAYVELLQYVKDGFPWDCCELLNTLCCDDKPTKPFKLVSANFVSTREALLCDPLLTVWLACGGVLWLRHNSCCYNLPLEAVPL